MKCFLKKNSFYYSIKTVLIFFTFFLKIVRNELGLVQIVEALSDTWQYLTAVAFDLGDDIHHAGLLHITENGIEAHHSALSDFPVVLYVQHLEPSGKLEEIIHRAVLSPYHPVHVHLEEDVLGVGMAEHIVIHGLALHLLELVCVVVVTVQEPVFPATLPDFVIIPAVGL